MSIQRWTFINGAEPHWLEEHPKGEYVTYADHLAAVAAAEQRVRDEVPYSETDAAYESGVKAARETVAALPVLSHEVAYATAALAKIDSLKTSLPASDDSAAPVLPTSVAPAGEDHGALIGRMITKQDDRYGYDVRDGLWMCRDCGAIVKHGWISMHDGLHDAIGYPEYPDVEEES